VLAEPAAPKERRLRAKIAGTLRAIDALHAIPAGGRIPIRYTAERNERGAFRYATDNGRPLDILISERGEHPALTTAHEVGHYIDRHALQVALGREPSQWATHTPTAALADWATAVFRSAAVGDMLAKTTPANLLYTPDPAAQANLSYNLRVEGLRQNSDFSRPNRGCWRLKWGFMPIIRPSRSAEGPHRSKIVVLVGKEKT